MKKKEKGQYGYINYYKKGKLLVTLILAIMIASIILSMLLAFGDTGRIGIIFAILLVLPFAKFLIAYMRNFRRCRRMFMTWYTGRPMRRT